MAQTIKIQDERIEAVRTRYGLDPQDFWQLPQNKQWCIKHSALEVVAAKEKITFDAPMIIEARADEGIATICVTGHMGERSIWSIGEASPRNSKNSYPWAMAEKRAIDRVVLKLAGIHGLLYSDTEVSASEERAQEASSEPVQALPVPAKSGLKDTAQRALWGRIVAATRECKTWEEFNSLWDHQATMAAYDGFSHDWKNEMDNEVNDKASELEQKFGKFKANPDFSNLAPNDVELTHEQKIAGTP